MMKTAGLILEFGIQSDLFWGALGESELKAIYENGFTFLEIWGHLSWFDLYSAWMASELSVMVKEHGLRVRSFHAPCEGDWNISSEDENLRRKSARDVIFSIENCWRLGGEIVVVHPGRFLTPGDSIEIEHDIRIRKSLRSFQEIDRAARDNGVLIAVENVTPIEVGGTKEYFLRLLSELNPEVFGVCYDSSHANLSWGSFRMFDQLEHSIITVHLSDNHGVYDEHRTPFSAAIDWHEVLGFLVRKNYLGPWLLEVTSRGYDPFEVLGRMRKATEKLREILVKIV